MIQYALKCENGHSFDSWFSSASAFDKLQSSNMVTCAICGSYSVEKGLMTPSVSGTRKNEAQDRPLSAPASPAEQMIAELRDKVEAESEYVGTQFASQARAMHEGDAPSKSIYGEANIQETKQLLDDGVPVLPLPFKPKGKTN